MELKVINEQGQEAAKLQASDVLFGREFNEESGASDRRCLPGQRPSGDSQQKDRSERSVTPPPSRGARRVRVVPVPVCNGSPLWRGGGRIFPNSPEQNYTPEG
jgi:large subunit ribosomal protein L4